MDEPDPKKDDAPKPHASQNDLEKKLKEEEAKRDEYLAGWQRAKADFINYKKEELQRLSEVAKYGSEELMLEFITVLDSFELGIAAMEKGGPVEKGVYMINAQIEDILKKRGLERIPVKIGDEFNPVIHETIKEVESDKPPGTIVEEVEAGYRLHDKVVRPARVKIAKEGHQS